jgi:hypothetical protein
MKNTRILLAAATAITILAAESDAVLVASDIAAEFRKERQRSRETTINVDHVAQATFPVGMDATAAEETLKTNGFKILYARPPSEILNARPASGAYAIVGSRFEASMSPFQDEYRIMLTIENNRLVSARGRIFWQSL